ncbi:hypothetical protein Daudx_0781 [Candidatus Desulforudis audaxviator]|nr:hypothetical protein Daudx_0781 [Candidatus Desulforudis audaxviator]
MQALKDKVLRMIQSFKTKTDTVEFTNRRGKARLLQGAG